MRVFENRVMRIFGSKRDEVTQDWRKLHNDELNDLYSSSNIVQLIKSRRMRGVYRILVGKPDGKRPLGRPRNRWEDNTKMHLKEVGWGMDWIDLARDRDRWQAILNLLAP